MFWNMLIFLFAIGALIPMASVASGAARTETAIFAGGCFWCMEPPFEKLDGVSQVTSGYTGGDEKDPTYQEVSGGATGHIESIRITYDPDRVSYSRLLDVFWMQVDPTDGDGQFVDRGPQYVSAIFYLNEEQKELAERSKKELQESGRFSAPVITPVLKAKIFYPAEEYHQDYYKKNQVRYWYYRRGSGRDGFLEKIWGKDAEPKKVKPKKNKNGAKYFKPGDAVIKSRLTPLQYKVTQHEGTEKAFDNEYWDNKKEGIYVDIVSGEPLFSSTDKYDSKTGWPSFIKPLAPENIKEKVDNGFFSRRTEV